MTRTTPRRARAVRRRRRWLAIRIAIELAVGAAAIWFVAHPRKLPIGPAATAADDGADVILPDSTTGLDTDSTTDARSESADSVRGRSGRAIPALPSLVPKLAPSGHLFRSIEDRARAGERVAVSVTAYCLQGRTRLGSQVHEGIVAVDPALFPLGRTIELFLGRSAPVRYRAEDTGGKVRGARIDVWLADCYAARRFGRRRGYAQLVPRSK